MAADHNRTSKMTMIFYQKPNKLVGPSNGAVSCFSCTNKRCDILKNHGALGPNSLACDGRNCEKKVKYSNRRVYWFHKEWNLILFIAVTSKRIWAKCPMVFEDITSFVSAWVARDCPIRRTNQFFGFLVKYHGHFASIIMIGSPQWRLESWLILMIFAYFRDFWITLRSTCRRAFQYFHFKLSLIHSDNPCLLYNSPKIPEMLQGL